MTGRIFSVTVLAIINNVRKALQRFLCPNYFTLTQNNKDQLNAVEQRHLFGKKYITGTEVCEYFV